MQGLIERTALYSDRHGVFFRLQPPVEATHFSRALVELGIQPITASALPRPNHDWNVAPALFRTNW